jgi:hypothetical protein
METLPEASERINGTLLCLFHCCVVFSCVVLQLGSMDLFLTTTDVNSTVHRNG